MKFTVNVDCTPEEARAFLGLPDFGPMQDAVIGQMQDQMQKNLNAMDPESMMKLWMPGAANGMQAFADLQKNIWEQMTGGLDAPAPKATKRKA